VNRIVAAFSQLLEPADRECVCGDLEELRLSTPAQRQTFWRLWSAGNWQSGSTGALG